MNKHSQIIDAITSKGLLPLYFQNDKIISLEVLKVLYNAGVRVVEYTNRGVEALENFKYMKKFCKANLPTMFLGIGTIKSTIDATNFIQAGADFLISPGFSEDIVELATEQEVLFIPGCQTPSEIMQAEALGAKMVKLFPGNVLGPAFVTAVKDVFPDIHFMPTGGVDTSMENLKTWFASGVSAVGIGGKLVSKELMSEKRYEDIAKTAVQVLQRIESIRK